MAEPVECADCGASEEHYHESECIKYLSAKLARALDRIERLSVRLAVAEDYAGVPAP